MSLSRKLATLIITERTTLSDVVASLTKYKMLSLLPSVRQALIQTAKQADTKNILMIESPFPLGDEAIRNVKNIIGKDSASHEVIINKNILAGFKARYKGILYNGSAERIIKQLTGSR